jgi:pimeloyl-ACP methyl ester carboxylesterase
MRLFSSVAVFAAAQAASLAAVQTEIHAPGPNGSLTGTVLTPDFTKGPVVLVVPGSGPIDRDGNASNAVRASTYRLLAEGLATHGIASVRIDKRGLYGSRAAVSDPNSVTIGDYADDVKTWISVIRRRTAAPCVWVLGHSEGGLVALAAAQTASDLCGLILVSTAGRPLGAVLREQLRANPPAGRRDGNSPRAAPVVPARGAGFSHQRVLHRPREVDCDLPAPHSHRAGRSGHPGRSWRCPALEAGQSHCDTGHSGACQSRP